MHSFLEAKSSTIVCADCHAVRFVLLETHCKVDPSPHKSCWRENTTQDIWPFNGGEGGGRGRGAWPTGPGLNATGEGRVVGGRGGGAAAENRAVGRHKAPVTRG